VGLTGGIASGKSEVTRRLASRGAVIIDADLIAREVVAPGTPGLAAVLAEFGTELLTAAGELDRSALAARVFGDPAALARLNAIVHPLVRAETQRRFAAADPDAIVVNDVPLLIEAGLTSAYDVIVVVSTSRETQLRRLTTDRGLTEAEAAARIAAQAPLAEKVAAATYVIHNDGSLAELDAQVDRLWVELERRARR
jgi:dephospho-CoA kinase